VTGLDVHVEGVETYGDEATAGYEEREAGGDGRESDVVGGGV
jgi:hypothetical protein